MKEAQATRVRIGVFELDLRVGELRQGEHSLILTEQPLRILRMLIERDGGLVEREEIKRKLWPNDTIVEFDHSINAAMKKLRQTLGDTPDEPKYIETIPRRGYRLIVPVEWVSASESSDAGPAVGAEPGRGSEASDDGARARVEIEPALLTGRTISHYRVLELIGGGGMGVVYRAEDIKLGRQVALKFLPEEVRQEPRALERFEREARAASALDHPNLCHIYEFGEHEGRPFLVMPLLRGQTLRERLAAEGSKALPLDELLDIAVQIARGLEAAHEEGIIHRDIKPANLFLTDKGVVKILDFGLAKLLEPSGEMPMAQAAAQSLAETPQRPDRGANLTRLGFAVGTEGYMSPEQVRGETVDARSDLFSFGVVLYEMATGRRAFSGETRALVRVAITEQAPVAVHELNTTLTPELEPIINKALEKDRARRYQSAAEMRAELEQVKRSREPLTPTLVPQPPRKKKWKRGQLAVAAVAVLVAAVAAGWYWRLRNHRVLTGNDSVVVADFSNQTTDPVFDEALNTALRIELEQTPFMNLLAADKVRGILKSLNRQENERLTPELASEVCRRSNSKAVVGGAIKDVGNRYHLELKATDCGSGTTLATVTQEAANRDEIVKTLGMAGGELRRQLGEPQDSLRRFNQPLERATSSSPEALQAFTEGLEQRLQHGDRPAMPRFRRAIELDPAFAQAYAALGMGYRNDNQPKLSVDNLRQAYDLRDRATQRERFFIDGVYFWAATGEREKATATFTEWTKTYPKDPIAHVRLSAVSMEVGQYEKAAAEARESLRLQPNAAAYMDEVSSYLSLNRLEEAKAGLDEAQSLNIGSHLLPLMRYELAFLQGDQSALEQSAQNQQSTGVLCLHSYTQAFHGRIAKERELLRQVVDRAMHDHAPDSAADCVTGNALQEAEIGDAGWARQQAAAALALSAARDIQARAALVLARAGDLEQAEKLSRQLQQDYPLDTMMRAYSLPTIRAAIELERNRPTQAIEALKDAFPYELGFGSFASLYPAYVRGQAYLTAGQAQPAALEFQKILDHPGIVGNSVLGALAHLQLGRAQVMMGDTDAARKSYQDFLTLWKDADPDIPIYKQAKAEYAKLQ